MEGLSWPGWFLFTYQGCSPVHRQSPIQVVIFGGDRREHVTPLLRDKLHWLRARERITFKLCLLVYKAINGLATSYLQDLCVPVTTVSTRAALRSAARGILLCLVPGDVSATGHFASLVPRRGTACRQTFELLCHWLLLKTYSRLIYSFSHIMQLNFEYPVLHGALVVTLWTCYRAL